MASDLECVSGHVAVPDQVKNLLDKYATVDESLTQTDESVPRTCVFVDTQFSPQPKFTCKSIAESPAKDDEDDVHVFTPYGRGIFEDRAGHSSSCIIKLSWGVAYIANQSCVDTSQEAVITARVQSLRSRLGVLSAELLNKEGP